MDAYKTAALTVLAAVRDYLPPDGISKDELISRVIEAVDNPEFNEGLHKPMVRVKPLEWEVYGVDIWEFSSYPNPYLIGRQSGDGRFWIHHQIVGDLRGSDGRIALHGAANEAKAAAQADYERRVLSAIET